MILITCNQMFITFTGVNFFKLVLNCCVTGPEFLHATLM